MLAIIGLVIAGILLISFEILVPGGILGALGGIAILGAGWVAFTEFGVFGAAWTLLLSLIVVTVVVIVEFQMLPKTRFGKRFFLSAASGGRIRYGSRNDAAVEASDQADLVGQTGIAATTMAPSGRIVVEGKTYEGFSQSGYLNKGDQIEVVGRDAFRVVVKKLQI
ncbi:MAG: NfeD family protein [Verrucomicrobiota bacterium]